MKPFRIAPLAIIVSKSDPLTQSLGSSEYVRSFAQMLRSQGYDVDMLVMAPPHWPGTIRIDAGSLDRYVSPYRKVRIFRTLRSRKSLWSLCPVQWRDRFRRLLHRRPVLERTWLSAPSRAELKWATRHISKANPDLVVANYFNSAEIFPIAGATCPSVVLAHDFFHERIASFQNSGMKPDFDPGIAVRELSGLAKADICICVKEADSAAIRRQISGLRTLVIPMTISAPTPPASAPEPVAVFVGGGFSANFSALAWLLKDVWPLVVQCFPDAILRVVGKVGDYSTLSWPQGAQKVGFVENLLNEYAKAAVAIAPMIVGSGLKIKVVEALSHGVPVVATPCGGEGLEHAPPFAIRIASDPREFADLLVRALRNFDNQSLRDSVHTWAITNFSQDHFGRQFTNALQDLDSIAS